MRPSLYTVTTDGGVHRRCTPEVAASAIAWLGEPPPSTKRAARYEVHRAVVMRAELADLVARHSIAEGLERARLATEIGFLHAALGEAT